MEATGTHRFFYGVVAWFGERDWLDSLSWMRDALASVGAFLASDVFLGIVIMAVVFLFADYRHAVSAWWDERRNPIDPARKAARHIRMIQRVVLRFDRDGLNRHLQGLRDCASLLENEPYVCLGLRIIDDLMGDGAKEEGRDPMSCLFSMYTFMFSLRHIVLKAKPPQRDEKAYRLLVETKMRLAPDSAIQKIMSVPVTRQPPDTLLPLGTGAESQR